MRKLLGVLTVVLALACVPVFADSHIDFGTGDAGAGGTITKSGSDYTGSGIPLNEMLVCIGATCTNYDLSGSAIGSNADLNGAASLDFDTATGAFSITGDVEDLGINSEITLLTGTIGGFDDSLCFNAFCLLSFDPASDTKNPELLDALGLAGTSWQMAGFTIGINLDQTNGTWTASSTDIINTEVPEPASLLLLGSGLLLGGSLLRRKVGL